MTVRATRHSNREVRVALASISLTLALGILGGNLRGGAEWIAGWPGWQRAAFFLCFADAVLIGWSPVRDFLRGDWRPFVDARLPENEEE